MRAIRKAREPRSLETFRNRRSGGYEEYPEKQDLRNALVQEQRGLCCYCMGRIRAEPGAMKIEHWRPRRRFPEDALRYRNLLAACCGGEGEPKSGQHCDTRKGDTEIRWNPAEPSHRIEERVRYGATGRISSDDEDFDRDLNETLNLNLPRLVNGRKGRLDAVVAGFRRRSQSREQVERILTRRETGTGLLAPFSPVDAWWLRRRLDVLTRSGRRVTPR